MSNEISVYQGAVDAIRSREQDLSLALPVAMRDRKEDFLKSVMIELNQNDRLLDAYRQHPADFFAALFDLARTGLQLGPRGHAYLVPYAGRTTLVVGYKGMIDIAYDAGVISLQTFSVFEGEKFIETAGLAPRIEHMIDRSVVRDWDHLVATYAVASLRGGGVVFAVRGRDELEVLRADARRKSGQKWPRSPWATSPVPIAEKAAIRKLFNRLPTSPRLDAALQHIDREIYGGEYGVTRDPTLARVTAPTRTFAEPETIDADEVLTDDGGAS